MEQGALAKWCTKDADRSPPTAVLVHGILGSKRNLKAFTQMLLQVCSCPGHSPTFPDIPRGSTFPKDFEKLHAARITQIGIQPGHSTASICNAPTRNVFGDVDMTCSLFQMLTGKPSVFWASAPDASGGLVDCLERKE
jgi:hypothetical protein